MSECIRLIDLEIYFRDDVEPLVKAMHVNYLLGYSEAILSFGIWNAGRQTIGCLETPVRLAIASKAREFDTVEKVFINGQEYLP